MIYKMDTKTEISSLMSKLNVKLNNLNQEVNRLEAIKKQLQELCSHEWRETGRHDSHREEYQCKICQKITWE